MPWVLVGMAALVTEVALGVTTHGLPRRLRLLAMTEKEVTLLAMTGKVGVAARVPAVPAVVREPERVVAALGVATHGLPRRLRLLAMTEKEVTLLAMTGKVVTLLAMTEKGVARVTEKVTLLAMTEKVVTGRRLLAMTGRAVAG